jgi:hypothetical protein
MRNRAQTMEAVKKEKEDEEGDLSDAEGEDEFPTAGGASGLGLNPEDKCVELPHRIEVTIDGAQQRRESSSSARKS